MAASATPMSAPITKPKRARNGGSAAGPARLGRRLLERRLDRIGRGRPVGGPQPPASRAAAAFWLESGSGRPAGEGGGIRSPAMPPRRARRSRACAAGPRRAARRRRRRRSRAWRRARRRRGRRRPCWPGSCCRRRRRPGRAARRPACACRGSLTTACIGSLSITPPPERCMICVPIRSNRSITRSSSASRRSGSSIRSERSTRCGAIAAKPTMRPASHVTERTSPPTPVVFWP